jgi:hypothetical protein
VEVDPSGEKADEKIFYFVGLFYFTAARFIRLMITRQIRDYLVVWYALEIDKWIRRRARA